MKRVSENCRGWRFSRTHAVVYTANVQHVISQGFCILMILIFNSPKMLAKSCENPNVLYEELRTVKTENDENPPATFGHVAEIQYGHARSIGLLALNTHGIPAAVGI